MVPKFIENYIMVENNPLTGYVISLRAHFYICILLVMSPKIISLQRRFVRSRAYFHAFSTFVVRNIV